MEYERSMKSITITDPITDAILIQVLHNKKGYFVKSRGDVQPFTCLIICDSGERLTIPVHRAVKK